MSENRVWVSRWVKLRAGVGLEVERGRHRKIENKKIERWKRTCKLCDCGQVEVFWMSVGGGRVRGKRCGRRWLGLIRVYVE